MRTPAANYDLQAGERKTSLELLVPDEGDDHQLGLAQGDVPLRGNRWRAQWIRRECMRRSGDIQETLKPVANRVRSEFSEEGERIGVDEGAEKDCGTHGDLARGGYPARFIGEKRQQEHQEGHRLVLRTI
jgi:hypothetical protein